MKFGKLVVVSGPMFADKTNRLIKEVLFETYFDGPQRPDVAVYKIAFDTRAETGVVESHDGRTVNARTVNTIEDIRIVPGGMAFFDEVQFFAPPYIDGDFIERVRAMRAAGMDVFCAGLDMDYMGRAFEVTAALMAEATSVEKMTSICSACGAPATRTARLEDGMGRFYPGASEIYSAMCDQHWFEDMDPRLQGGWQ